MKVTKHFIRAPAADKADDVRINLCQKKGSSTSCTEASCRDITWKKPQVRAEVGDSVPNA